MVAVTEAGSPNQGGISVGVVNLLPTYDPAINLRKYLEFIEQAGRLGVKILAFPEQSLQGYLWETAAGWNLTPEALEHQHEHAEPIPGPATAAIQEAAAPYGMYVVAGMTERLAYAGGGGLCNAAALIGPRGVVGVFRKVHLPGGETHAYVPGREFPVFPTAYGRIGLLICYDICFPEAARVYAINGADLLIHPTAWPKGGSFVRDCNEEGELQLHAYQAMLRTRALENQIWIASSGCCGLDPRSGWDFCGHSQIVHPSGLPLGNCADNEGLLAVHGIRLREGIRQARNVYMMGANLMKDRKPHLYGPVADSDAMVPPSRSCAIPPTVPAGQPISYLDKSWECLHRDPERVARG